MPIIISPAQALLKLIEHYRKPEMLLKKENTEHLATLYRLYLDGAVNPAWRTSLTNFVTFHRNDVFEGFKVSTEAQIIDNDPTKRYFETHLAFETLKSVCKTFPSERLEYFAGQLKDMLSTLDKPSYENCEKVINGNLPDNPTELFKEYAELFNRIKENKVFTNEQGFSDDDRKKIQLIITCNFLCVGCAQSNIIHNMLPLKVYEQDSPCLGFFGNQRGKILKNKVDAGQSRHYGLIKGHMPLSTDDVAYSVDTFGFLKSSEQAKYNENAQFIKESFNYLVHPFSNSISGTLLCIIRNLSYLQNNNIFPFTETKENFHDFIRAVSSVIVSYSGGHSLHELIRVLRLTEIIDELETKRPFTGHPLELNKTFISNIFLEGNEQAFKNALQKTIEYNNQYILRKQANAKIRQMVTPEIREGIATIKPSHYVNRNKEQVKASESNDRFFSSKRKTPDEGSSSGINRNEEKGKAAEADYNDNFTLSKKRKT